MLRNVSALLFANSEALAAAAEAASSDPRLAKSRLEMRRGTVADAARWMAENHSPDVLIISDPCDETCWDRFEKLAEVVEPQCRVVVIGPQDHISVYREMLARGVADYLGGDIEPHEIVDCLARLFVAEESLPKGRLVAVLPAVGGAGASTMSAALAYSLSRRMGDCVLMDMDLTMGTAALQMGIDPRDPLSQALANPGLDAAMLERFMAREGAVRLLSTAGSLRDARWVDGDAMERVTAVARSMTKAVVVDMPKGWGEAQERLCAIADEVVVVARPDLASLRNCRMIVDDVTGRRVDGRRPRIVLNGIGAAKKHEYGTTDFAEAGGAVPAAIIPFDPEPLAAVVTEGKPLPTAQGKAMPAMLAFADTVLAPEGGRTATKTKSDPLVALKGALGKLAVRKTEKA